MMRSIARGGATSAAILDIAILCVAGVLAFAVYERGRPDRLILNGTDWVAALDGEAVLGEPAARIQVVEFVDYQCPGCLVMEGVLSEIAAEYPKSFRRVVRHYPLSRIHPRADSAALIAICAAKVGSFQLMHRTLFEHRQLVDAGQWDSVATRAAIHDSEFVERCFGSPTARDFLERDRRLGRRLGISGTPTLIVDGEWLRGADPPRVRAILLGRLR